MIIRKDTALFCENQNDESTKIYSVIKKLLDRANINHQKTDQLTITIFIPRLFSRLLHPAIYLYPFKEMKISPNCTEYDFYHELGHHIQKMRFEYLSISSSHREVFANAFMRKYGKLNTRVFTARTKT